MSSTDNVITETNIPNFLLKLWKLVDDPKFQSFIAWDISGLSFKICDPSGFSRQILPLYFKHSNLNSFIRQLNLYGFRKVNNLEKGSIRPSDESEILEFQHPYFVADHPELLELIKRKMPTHRSRMINLPGPPNNLALTPMDSKGDSPVGKVVVDGRTFVVRPFEAQRKSRESLPVIATPNPSADQLAVLGEKLDHVLQEMRTIRSAQSNVDKQFSRIQLENETLWREVALMRRTHLKQQEIVNKLIKFLLLFSGRRAPSDPDGANSSKSVQLEKRRLLAIDSASGGEWKRRRLSNVSSTGCQPNTSGVDLRRLPTAKNHEEAAGIIASLERELLSPLDHKQTCDEITIADVTNDLLDPVNDTKQQIASATEKSSSPAFGASPFIDNVSGAQRPLRVTKWPLNSPRPAQSPSFLHQYAAEPKPDNEGQGSSGIFTSDVTAAPSPPQSFVVTAAPSPAPLAPFLDNSCAEPLFEGQVDSTNPQRLTSDAASLNPTEFASTNYNYSSPSPIFTDLNSIQSELDEVKELLSSDFKLSTNDLNELFSMSENNPLYRMNAPGKDQLSTDGNEIMGNEVQVYRSPASVVKSFSDSPATADDNFAVLGNLPLMGNFFDNGIGTKMAAAERPDDFSNNNTDNTIHISNNDNGNIVGSLNTPTWSPNHWQSIDFDAKLSNPKLTLNANDDVIANKVNSSSGVNNNFVGQNPNSSGASTSNKPSLAPVVNADQKKIAVYALNSNKADVQGKKIFIVKTKPKV